MARSRAEREVGGPPAEPTQGRLAQGLPAIDGLLTAAFRVADDWFAQGRALFEWRGCDEQDPGECVLKLLYHNFQVWHYEDYGRTDDDALILLGWRGAMLHNRHRNDLINAIDAWLAPFHHATAPLHSESVGALVDRVTILYLKYKNYLPRCAATAARVREQLEELSAYAADLQARIMAGEARCQQVPRLKLYLPSAG